MKRLGFLFFLSLLVNFPFMAKAISIPGGETTIESSTEIQCENAKGNVESSSAEEGEHFVENLNWDLLKDLTSANATDPLKFNSHLSTRITDNPQYQTSKKNFYIHEAFMKLFNNEFQIWGGDFAESFTTYTLSTSLLGIDIHYFSNSGLKLYSFVGRNRDKDLDGYLRYTEGIRASFEKKVGHIGISLVNSEVDTSTLSPDPSKRPVEDEKNSVGSIDFSIKPKDYFTFSGEIARSMYNENQSNSTYKDQYDNAYLLNVEWEVNEKLGLKGSFERVEPWFKSVYGSASADLQRYRLEAQYQILENLDFFGSYEYSFDKISDHSDVDERTYTRTASGSFNYSPFMNREDYWNTFNINYQVDYFKSYNKINDPNTDNEELRSSISASQSFEKWDYTLTYEYARTWDYVDSSTEYFSHSPSLTVNFNANWFDLQWNWNFNLSYMYKKTIVTDYVDKNYRGEVNLGILRQESNTNLNLSFSMERNMSNNYEGNIRNTLYAYGIVLDQPLLNKETLYASLNVSYNHNTYVDTDSSKDYREDLLHLRLDLKF